VLGAIPAQQSMLANQPQVARLYLLKDIAKRDKKLI